jgi:hypothetical protein
MQKHPTWALIWGKKVLLLRNKEFISGRFCVIDKELSTAPAPSPRLHRAEEMLENQNNVPAPVEPVAPKHPKPVAKPKSTDAAKLEVGGPEGQDPTRYGDWERNGRCIDF